jgi:hypothetical protein
MNVSDEEVYGELYESERRALTSVGRGVFGVGSIAEVLDAPESCAERWQAARTLAAGRRSVVASIVAKGKDDARVWASRTPTHEAGHVVAAQVLGLPVRRASVIPDHEAGGRTSLDPQAMEDDPEATAIMALAGPAAVVHAFGSVSDESMSGDLPLVYRALRQAGAREEDLPILTQRAWIQARELCAAEEAAITQLANSLSIDRLIEGSECRLITDIARLVEWDRARGGQRPRWRYLG